MAGSEYYDHTTYPSTGAPGSSSALRAELELIEAGFGKGPALSGNGGKAVLVNAGGTALEAVAVTGTGSVVLNTSPTLVTPALGTPASGVMTNVTGTAAGLTAGNVTTNANLTGHITSTGNAAVLGSFSSSQLATALTDETGSGAAVFATSPTLVTPLLGTPTSGVLTNCTGTAAGLTAGGNALLAGSSTQNFAVNALSAKSVDISNTAAIQSWESTNTSQLWLTGDVTATAGNWSLVDITGSKTPIEVTKGTGAVSIPGLHVDGWTKVADAWTCTTAGVAGSLNANGTVNVTPVEAVFTVLGDVTTTYFRGVRVKYTQTTVKYGYVNSSSYSAGTGLTTVTLIANADYQMGLSSGTAITLPAFSFGSPAGFPEKFAYIGQTVPATGTFTTITSTLAFTMFWRNCMVIGSVAMTNAGTGSGALVIAAPFPASGNNNTGAGREVAVNGTQLIVWYNNYINVAKYDATGAVFTGWNDTFSFIYQ